MYMSEVVFFFIVLCLAWVLRFYWSHKNELGLSLFFQSLDYFA